MLNQLGRQNPAKINEELNLILYQILWITNIKTSAGYMDVHHSIVSKCEMEVMMANLHQASQRPHFPTAFPSFIPLIDVNKRP